MNFTEWMRELNRIAALLGWRSRQGAEDWVQRYLDGDSPAQAIEADWAECV
jgi:hypothetical protein|tara:strand:- start:321 stop:473 length:153 start_codon:yes stop_codon:yes gene_type:complete